MNRKYTIDAIAKILDGHLLQRPNPKALIVHLQVDSRKISFAPSTLFFALVTPRRDGHSFIRECYDKGVRNFIISTEIDFKAFPAANFIGVKDTLKSLQQLAAHHRQQFNYPIIGITGSNGKTMIKEWLFQLLNPDYHIVRSPKSYNSQIGVPLSIWQMNETHNLGIFEAGISQMDEMQQLAPIIDCTIGIFTTLGTAHDEGFESSAIKLAEKLKLFKHTDILIYAKDQTIVQTGIQGQYRTKNRLAWSRADANADLYIKQVKLGAKRCKISGIYRGESVHIYLPFTDSISIENATHCWLVLLHLGIPNTHIQQRMLRLEPVRLRVEVKQGVNNCLIINDAYNTDLTSLEMLFQFMEQHHKLEHSTLIISDLLQSGLAQKELYQKTRGYY